MIQATKDKDAMGRKSLCTCPKEFLWESMCDIGFAKISVMTTTSPDDSMTAVVYRLEAT